MGEVPAPHGPVTPGPVLPLTTTGAGPPCASGEGSFLEEPTGDKMNNKAPSGWLLLVTLTSD